MDKMDMIIAYKMDRIITYKNNVNIKTNDKEHIQKLLLMMVKSLDQNIDLIWLKKIMDKMKNKN